MNLGTAWLGFSLVMGSLLSLLLLAATRQTYAQQTTPYPSTNLPKLQTSQFPTTQQTAPPQVYNNRAQFSGSTPEPTRTSPPSPAAAQGYDSRPGQTNVPATIQPIEAGQIVARVGTLVVTADEILPAVNEIIASNPQASQAPPEELKKVRLMLMQKRLDSLIETKLLYAAARKQIPDEHFPTIEERLTEQFEKVQMPRLLEVTKASTRRELEAFLNKTGSSIAMQRRGFSERLIAQQWLRDHIDVDAEVTHQQMLDYYQKHKKDYTFEPSARWEELVASFSEYRSKAEAYSAIADWGNQVLQGKPFSEVAKQHSHGASAYEGGGYDWTSRGALKSQAVNRALFTLPVGGLSQIIETETDFRIIRVLERRDGGCKPFLEAQVEIRNKINQQRHDKGVKQYMAKLKKEIKVWTMFDTPETETASSLGDRY